MISTITGSNLAIGVSLYLNDGITGKAQQAANSLREFSTSAERAAATNIRNVNAIGAAVGLGAIQQMRQWVLVGAEFDKRMKYLESISDSAGTAFDNKVLKEKARQVGMDTMFSTTQIAGAMVTMGQAGQTAEDIHKNIQSVAVLAAATMSDIESTSSYMNDIMIGFQIPASAENSMRVADIITKSINDSNLKLQDFGESMKYVIPTAQSLGISLEEVAAMLSTIGNAGIKGSMAGTNLENMFRYMATAAGKDGRPKQVNALAALGLTPEDLRDANGELKTGAELINMFGKAMNSMDETSLENFNAMVGLVGVRGGRAGNILAQQFQHFEKFLDKINNSDGTAQKTADDVMGTLAGSIEQVNSSLENLKTIFTDSITPVLQPVLEGFIKLVKVISELVSTPLGATITAIAAGVVVVKTAVMGWRASILTLRMTHSMMTGQVLTNLRAIAAQQAIVTAGAAGVAGAAGAGAAGTAAATATAGRVASLAALSAGGAGILGSLFMRNAGKGFTTNSAGRIIDTKTGRFASGAAVDSHIGKYQKIQGRIATANKWAGRGSVPAMLGGMALDYGAEAVGRDTTAGQVMGVAGSTLSMAGTGAMIGSIFPGIGTAAGAIAGAAIGLGMGIYNNMQQQKANIEAATEQIESSQVDYGETGGGDWLARTQQYLGLVKNKPHYFDDYNARGRITTPGWNGQNLNPLFRPTPNQITINIDGQRTMSKLIQETNYSERINLGL